MSKERLLPEYSTRTYIRTYCIKMKFTPFLLPSRSGNLGKLELNNPKALNALNFDIVSCLSDVLSIWKNDNSLKATMMTGSGDKAFCAGGDIKSLYEDYWNTSSTKHGYGHGGLLTADFFRTEYEMNHKIATQTIPQISIWDGIVMGGGVGVSVHGKYRIATDTTVFAKPETGIGLFPDVGGMFWLPRCKGGLGPYIALTGARLNANDLLYAGIATHYVPSHDLNDLKDALIDATTTEGSSVGRVLMSFHKDIPTHDSFLAKHRTEIDNAFDNKTSIEQIIEQLSQKKDSEFSKKTLSTLDRMSPTSLKVTLEGLKRGKSLPTIKEVLEMEYRMAQAFMRDGSDFYEGVRALLVDKDKNPQWNPKTLAEVSNETVETYFQHLGDNELILPSTNEVESKL